MTFTQAIRSTALMVMLAVFPRAAAGGQTAAQEPCANAFTNITPQGLEQRLQGVATERSHCYVDKLVEWGENAVPLLIRLLNDERHFSRCLARTAIARREAARDRSHADDPDPEVFLVGVGCYMADPDDPAELGARYLLTSYPDPGARGAVNRKNFDLFWKFTEGHDSQRIDALHVLLAQENLSRHTVSVLAPFVAAMGRRAGIALPQLRAGLRVPHLGADLVDPFLAVQGNEIGIAHLLKVYGASSDAAMHTAIELALKKRASPVELDQHLFNAVNLPVLLPAALDLMRKGIASPRTADYLAARPNNPLAIDAAGSAPGCTADVCPEVACRSASLAPLAPSDLPMLKVVYRDAARAGATDCLAAVAGMIAEIRSGPALDFLYERFLDGGNEEHTYLLSQILMRNVEQLLPRIEAEIGGLRDGPLAAVESLLLAPAARDALQRQRARVLPGLLALPLRKDADDLLPEPISGYGLVIRSGPGILIGRYPATRGALAVRRIGQLAPMTPEVVSALLRVAAGPYDETGYQAVAVLDKIKNDDRSLGGARLKEIRKLLAKTPPGFAHTRLGMLEMYYRSVFGDDASPGTEMD